VEVEVANFYPALASRLGTPLYKATQSRVHVLITRAFLRSLARMDLAESRVGRFARTAPDTAASIDDVPDPPPPADAVASPLAAGQSRSRTPSARASSTVRR
jgi:hypothetical protein